MTTSSDLLARYGALTATGLAANPEPVGRKRDTIEADHASPAEGAEGSRPWRGPGCFGPSARRDGCRHLGRKGWSPHSWDRHIRVCAMFIQNG